MVTNFPRSPDRIHGGVEKASLGLVRGLVAFDDLSLHVVAVGAAGGQTEAWSDPPCTVYRVPTSWPGVLTAWNLTRRRVTRCLRRISPDLVHVQGYGGWLSPAVRLPSVFTVHGIQERDLRYTGGRLKRVKRAIVSVVEGRARRRFRHVICISPYVLNELGDQIAGEVCAIDNPVEEAFFDVHRREVPGRLLYVGVLNARKNIHGLLEVAHWLAGAGVSFDFRIAGPPAAAPYAARLRADVARFGLAGRVRFVGALSPEQVREELAQAACLLLASFQETAPVVISEAMAGAVPVVATGVCGVPYMVEDGKTGYVVPSGDMEAMAGKVARVLGDSGLRQAMGAAASAAARNRFHPEVVARRTLDVYAEAVGEEAPAA